MPTSFILIAYRCICALVLSASGLYYEHSSCQPQSIQRCYSSLVKIDWTQSDFFKLLLLHTTNFAFFNNLTSIICLLATISLHYMYTYMCICPHGMTNQSLVMLSLMLQLEA